MTRRTSLRFLPANHDLLQSLNFCGWRPDSNVTVCCALDPCNFIPFKLFVGTKWVFQNRADYQKALASPSASLTAVTVVHAVRPELRGRLSKPTTMEVNMTRKITAAAAVALLIGSAGIASAQTNTHAARVNGVSQAPFTYSYYNEDYWRAIEPNGSFEQRDPYAGTIWEGVAPY
jgi:hypothetical protein